MAVRVNGLIAAAAIASRIAAACAINTLQGFGGIQDKINYSSLSSIGVVNWLRLIEKKLILANLRYSDVSLCNMADSQ